MQNDPLEVLIVPHEVVEWQRKKGLLMKKYVPAVLKAEREKGKYAIFHDKLRLYGLYETAEQANNHILEIIGNKRRLWENKRIYSVKQL